MKKTRNRGKFKFIKYKDLAHFSRDSSFNIENFLKEDNVIIDGVPTVLNYADLPNASLFNKKVFKVLNFGLKGSYWISNGVKWMLMNYPLCIGASYTDINLAAGANNYRSLYSFLIPTDGTLSALRQGDILRLTSQFIKNGTTSTLGKGYSLGATSNSSNNNSGFYAGTNGTVDASVVQLENFGPSSNTFTHYVEEHNFQRIGAASFKKNGMNGSSSIYGSASSYIGGTINLATATPPINSFDTSNVYFNVCFATEAVDSGTLKYLKLELIPFNS